MGKRIAQLKKAKAIDSIFDSFRQLFHKDIRGFEQVILGDVDDTCIKDISEICKLYNDGSPPFARKRNLGSEVNALIS